ncbi:HTH_Tnp_Tc3_2 domain-containing protein [Trichonephila clavipes]|nr:HTH_Tnp_Tc3_2 domain-containing protein [Trichonephila clavipes]
MVKRQQAMKKVMYVVFFRCMGLVKAIKLKGQKMVTANWYTTKFLPEILQEGNLEVSEELGITQSVISKFWQRFQDDGNVSRCYSTGRPRDTTPNEDQYLAVTAKRSRRNTASDLSRQHSSATGTTVSRQTVYKRLEHIGLYACRPVRCVPLTATYCRLRLTWSRDHALGTPQQWSCVMFSDESSFSLESDSRRTLIWRVPGTIITKRKPLNDTVTMVQHGSFGEELFLVPELTCQFRV